MKMAVFCFRQNAIFAINRFRVLLLRNDRPSGAKHPAKYVFLMRGIKISASCRIYNFFFREE